jgi:hypothetical protein
MKFAYQARLVVGTLLVAAPAIAAPNTAPDLDPGLALGLELVLAPLVESEVPAAAGPVETERGWVVERADNVCGLDDPRMLSYPARVEYDALLASTAEIKRIREEGIDPGSSTGIQLRQQAVDRVRRACDKVRRNNGHCSVWKRISHRDGRTIPDITEAAKGEL